MATGATTLDFEKPIVELESKIDELKQLAGDRAVNVDDEIAPLERKLSELRGEIYKNLTPLQRVQVARNAKRPFTLDYMSRVFTDFIELHGDRAFREDAAIVGGWARLDGETVMVIGHQRGRDTKENLKRNFGMPHPEGYRKALRLMKLAEKFHVPVLTFIDTPGAWAGLGAEERGQSEAIARNLFEMSRLEVPIIATVIGEGGSGGALALGVADRVNAGERRVFRDHRRGVRGDPVEGRQDPGDARARRERAAHHGAGPARAARDRRDHSGAARRRARESRGDGARACGRAQYESRGVAEAAAGAFGEETAAEVSADGPVGGVGFVVPANGGIHVVSWEGMWR